jgi:hypothetical protein
MSRWTKANHTAYMGFMFRDGGWQVHFLEGDLETSLPRRLVFQGAESGAEKRGEAWTTSEARSMLNHALGAGRGGCYLRLRPDQYRALMRT